MSWKEKHILMKREQIAELVMKIDNLWILGQIYTFIVNMTREGDKA